MLAALTRARGWAARCNSTCLSRLVAGGADSFFVISGSGRPMEISQQIDPLGPRCGCRPPSPIPFS